MGLVVMVLVTMSWVAFFGAVWVAVVRSRTRASTGMATDTRA